MGYISTIKTAVQLFPFLAFLLTLPYMILNYRKYGSVNKLRVLIFYSFMLYLFLYTLFPTVCIVLFYLVAIDSSGLNYKLEE